MTTGSTLLGDTWTWNGTTWTQLTRPPVPAAREGASMAYDPATQTAALFGGQITGSTDLGDTWTWNGTNWTPLSPGHEPSSPGSGLGGLRPQRPGAPALWGSQRRPARQERHLGLERHQLDPAGPATSPPGRSIAAMASGPEPGQVLLFGGLRGGLGLGDSWTWNGSTWTQVTGSGPVARSGADMAADTATGQLVLFGGLGNSSFPNDTWNYGPVETPTATSLAAAPSTVGFGAPVTLTASLAPATGPTGTVTFSDTANGQTTTLGTENVSAGTATYTGALPAVGVNALTASYSGDTAYGGSTSATVNVTVTAPRGLLTVTQLRFSGPNGGGDGYVDLQNTSSTMALPLAGWSLGVATTGGTSTVALPSGTTIPPGGHFLVTGSDYSLASVAAADLPSLPSGVTGVALDPPTSGGPATDQVGYPVTAGYYGGSGLPSLSGSPSDQYAFVRAGSQTQPTNSGNNATDFELVSTDTASFALSGGGSAQAVLGSPSPLSLTSAQQKDSLVPSTLVVPSAGSTSCPNRVVTAGGANTPTTLVINRTVTNSTGKPITSLVFRITTLTQQYGPPSGSHAWLTVVGSADPSTVTCGATHYSADGLSLNGPTNSSGGGLGTTLSPSEVSPGNPLAPGASIVVSFEFVVTQGGSFTVGYDTDVTLGS